MDIQQRSLGQNQPRAIRVFVSSTFRDMQAERDELVKFIFPQLRKLCEQRGVTWGEVDLRWGITDEQKAEGKVLPICLEEIRRCRPYFIGVLGERYGWIPDEFPAELVTNEPWLAGHPDRSVTELEILHGVLNNPEMAEHAFFYFRDPAYLEMLAPSQRAGCLEGVIPQETEQYGSAGAEKRAQIRREKLADLKQRIRASGFPVRENYRDPKHFGELVLKDLTAIVHTLFPQELQPDPLMRERLEHAAYATSRQRVYIARPEYYARLDTHASSQAGQPLTISGDSGSGKSALLANWAGRFRSLHPDVFLIEHYIGATPTSADWAAIVRRILNEFKLKFSITQPIPENPNELRNGFSNWLHMAAAHGQVVIIIDALNLLEDRDGAPDLTWLPPVLPPEVRLVVSTLPGRALDEINRRGWTITEIGPLELDERVRLIESFLAQYTKHLGQDHLQAIAHAPQTATPLFLRLLLDELRQFGIQERLEDQIQYYLEAQTVDDLYDRILKRYEADYEKDRPGLVSEAMTNLWAARHGLSEPELLDLLGSTGQPLPGSIWSPFNMAVENALVNHAGQLGFLHDHLRQAVSQRYLTHVEQQRVVHLRLARYFQGRPVDHRQAEELPFHYLRSGEWQNLANLLWDLDFVAYAWDHGHDRDLVSYWMSLRGRAEPANGYQTSISRLEESGANPNTVVSHCRRIAIMLDRMALFADSRKFYERAVHINERLSGLQSSETASDWRWIGLSYYAEGNFEQALRYLKQALKIEEHLHGLDSLAMADLLNDIGLVYWEHGDYKEAKAYAGRSLELREKLLGPNHRDVALSLNNLAAIYHVQDLYAEALPLYQRALTIRQNVLSPEDTDVAQILNNMGSLYTYLGRPQEGLANCLKALKIYEQAHGPFHPYVSVVCNNIAIAQQNTGNFEESEKWMRRVLEISEVALGSNHPEMAKYYLNLANSYAGMKRWQEALKYKKRALDVVEKNYGAHHYQTSYIAKELAATYIHIGDLENAELLLERAKADIQAEFGESHPALAGVYYWFGILNEIKQEFPLALDYYQKATVMAVQLLGPEHQHTKAYRGQFDKLRERVSGKPVQDKSLEG